MIEVTFFIAAKIRIKLYLCIMINLFSIVNYEYK